MTKSYINAQVKLTNPRIPRTKQKRQNIKKLMENTIMLKSREQMNGI